VGRRKPDLLIILAFLLCIGVVVTSYGGVLLEEKEIKGPTLKLSGFKKQSAHSIPEPTLKLN
jgi:hypothetical protein